MKLGKSCNTLGRWKIRWLSSHIYFSNCSLRSGLVFRGLSRERIYGAKSYRDLTFKFKLVMAILHTLTGVFVLMIIFAVTVIVWMGVADTVE